MRVIRVVQDSASGDFYIAQREGAVLDDARRIKATSDSTGSEEAAEKQAENEAPQEAQAALSSAKKLLGGAPSATDIVAPGASTSYQIDGLPAGTYFFRCDVHPTTMTGQFVVTAKKAPAGSSSPTPAPSASASA